MNKITTILVDDEKLALNRMADLLKLFPYVKIIAKEFEPQNAIQTIVKNKPDIVFLDVEMPGMTGFNIIEDVRKQFVHPTFIIVTAYNQYAIKAIKKETFDYLIKPVDIDDLRETLERFERNRNHFPYIDNSILSEREKEVARLICRGKTSHEIGEILFISKNTVDTHRRKILEKLKVKSTAELMIKCKLISQRT